MGVVVNFKGYRPAARFDGEPWTEARVEEADVSTGPWTTIDTLALDPLDADPALPQLRSLTSENGTAPARWYRLVFLDADSDESLPSAPIQNAAETTVPLDSDALCDFELTKQLVGWKSTSEANDDQLRSLINDVSDLIHEYTGRQFVVDEEPATLRYLLETDDVEERSLMIDDLSAPAETIEIRLRDGTLLETVDLALVEQLTHSRRRGRPIVELGFVPGFSGSALLARGNAVDVTGTWGWPEIPETVTRFAMNTVAAWATRDLSKFSASFRLDSQRVEIPRVLPDTVKAGLKLFRRTPVGGVQVGREVG
jgi:hypothetical protein